MRSTWTPDRRPLSAFAIAMAMRACSLASVRSISTAMSRHCRIRRSRHQSSKRSRARCNSVLILYSRCGRCGRRLFVAGIPTESVAAVFQTSLKDSAHGCGACNRRSAVTSAGRALGSCDVILAVQERRAGVCEKRRTPSFSRLSAGLDTPSQASRPSQRLERAAFVTAHILCFDREGEEEREPIR